MSRVFRGKKHNVSSIRQQKGRSRIVALTAYDYPTARMLDVCGVEIILVGDSMGNVVYGNTTTHSVTIDQMIDHTLAASRGVESALLVADMPFMSYRVSEAQALENAGRLISEGNAQAIKLEGGKTVAPMVERMVDAGIPVMGHIGLMPQSIHLEGKFRKHGKTKEEIDYLIESALALEKAGAFSVVLECVETDVAKQITEMLKIPTIGIGSEDVCDGEILVFHDLVGYGDYQPPKFVEPLANLRVIIEEAVSGYVSRTKKLDRESEEQPAHQSGLRLGKSVTLAEQEHASGD